MTRDEKRFWDKVEITPQCWLWCGAKNQNGYGRFRLDGRTQVAHRVSWYWKHGDIAPDLELDHLCGVRACVRPDHLEAVSHFTNLQRSLNKRSRVPLPWRLSV